MTLIFNLTEFLAEAELLYEALKAKGSNGFGFISRFVSLTTRLFQNLKES
jgi:hypothetical protein